MGGIIEGHLAHIWFHFLRIPVRISGSPREPALHTSDLRSTWRNVRCIGSNERVNYVSVIACRLLLGYRLDID